MHCRNIAPGDPYLELCASPNHGDLGNLGWWRLDECLYCVAVSGRLHHADSSERQAFTTQAMLVLDSAFIIDRQRVEREAETRRSRS